MSSRELLDEFRKSTNGRNPYQVVIFRYHMSYSHTNGPFDVHNVDLVELMHVLLPRDGISESQFNQVLNYELDQIIKVPISFLFFFFAYHQLFD